MPTLTSSKESCRQLRAKAPSFSDDIYITRVEGAGADSGDDLSNEELAVEIGLTKDKIRYIAQYVSYEFPDIPSKTIYSAVGTAIKRYSFVSVLLATKTIKNLDADTFFPRFIYACKSFYATEVSSKAVDTAKVVDGLKKRGDSEKLRVLLKTPEDSVFALLLDGVITKEQYQKVKDSKDACSNLIMEVVGNDTGGAA